MLYDAAPIAKTPPATPMPSATFVYVLSAGVTTSPECAAASIRAPLTPQPMPNAPTLLLIASQVDEDD